MNLEQRTNAFVKLGEFLKQFTLPSPQQNEDVLFNDVFFDGFKHQIKLSKEHNGWFTDENIRFAINSWARALSKEQLDTWLKPYNFKNSPSQKVAVIMAGNIPLVGFHDFLSVLISGHHILVKQSSNDKHLLPFIAKYLEYVEPNFKDRISFHDGQLKDFDAVIATGSNNTARYFEYYFKNKPSLIRRNRNSVAVITGQETEEEMQLLSNDIFTYFGLGCRNVSKIFVPENYNFEAFFKGIYDWNEIIEGSKYANNYDYNKAVYIMSEFNMLENGFLMIKEDQSYSSPIATIFYEYYSDLDKLREKLKQDQDLIQCVVSNMEIASDIKFGQTQHPELSDYADGVDTLAFLSQL